MDGKLSIKTRLAFFIVSPLLVFFMAIVFALVTSIGFMFAAVAGDKHNGGKALELMNKLFPS